MTEDKLTQIFISEDKGASYLRFARFLVLTLLLSNRDLSEFTAYVKSRDILKLQR